MSEPLLAICDLKVVFPDPAGRALPVAGVSLELAPGEVLGLVGESGCGKSLTALAILKLIDPPGAIAHGEVRFGGRNLLALSERELAKIRGDRIAMVFQEPDRALNPVMTIGAHLAEPFKIHRRWSRREIRRRSLELLEEVAVPDAERRLREFPHQLSGGLKQRVLIAMALACDPDLLIADEPTTALDTTVQAGILELLARLQQQRRLAVLLISHDLGVVAEYADRVAIMYAGQIVEQAPVEPLFAAPRHPYTQALLRATPALVPGQARPPLTPLAGAVPDPARRPPGCAFAPRCPERMPECEAAPPPFFEVGDQHRARCILYRPQAVSKPAGSTME
ncbi:MAG TPA: ABC transporter ATP-binding protein [Acidobacteriota bacterium]